jgi:hypothetical protein
MDENRKMAIGIILLVLAVALFVNLPYLIQQTNPTTCTTETGDCLHEERVNQLTATLPLFVILGFVLGVLVFYFTSSRKTAVQAVPKKETLLLLLEGDERKVVERVSAEGGRVLQSEISHYPGIGKVKAHRIIERLVSRGVIQKESHGKTNLVKLSPQIKALLVDSQ